MVVNSNFPETADIETSSEDYASRFAGAVGTWMLDIQTQGTLKMLQPYPGASVLDVGGGHAQITAPLVENNYQVTVLGSAEVCQERIKPWLEGNRCAFDVGNVLDLPYPDNAFDVAISYRFLAHVTAWEKFLSELMRVSKKAVIVDYPTVRSVNSIAPLLFKLKKGLEGNTRPFITYEEPTLVNYFQAAGWQQTERFAQFFWPMVLHRTLKSPPISSALEQSTRLMGLTYWLGSPVIAKFSPR